MLMAARMRNNRSRLWYHEDGSVDGNAGHPPGPDYFQCTEPVACNYFAVNGIASLTDMQATAALYSNSSSSSSKNRRRLSVLTDRSQGSTSMANGQIELMLHRRLASGCRWGMCSDGHETAGLNDTLGSEVLIKHWLTIDSIAEASLLADSDSPANSPVFAASPSLARVRSRELNYPLSTLFGTAATASDWTKTRVKHPSFAPFAADPFASLSAANGFPDNVDLTSFTLLNASHAVLRLTHLFPAGEHPTLSTAVTVDFCATPGVMGPRVCALLKAALPSGLQAAETSAAANIGLADLTTQRLKWKVIGEEAPRQGSATAAASPYSVLLHPGDTRTFVFKHA
jgi:alpha-mannosidase